MKLPIGLKPILMTALYQYFAKISTTTATQINETNSNTNVAQS